MQRPRGLCPASSSKGAPESGRTLAAVSRLAAPLLLCILCGPTAAQVSCTTSSRPTGQIQSALPSQPLADALSTYAIHAGILILIDETLVKGLIAPALDADFCPDVVLARMLEGTGLSVVRLNDRMFTIKATLEDTSR
jgi:hemoglobin/transferrin/lactoferrin receptor protein